MCIRDSLPASALIHPEKPLKDPLLILRLDAHAVILYLDADHILLLPDLRPHMAARMIVLDAVAHQIEQKLTHLLQACLQAHALALP